MMHGHFKSSTKLSERRNTMETSSQMTVCNPTDKVHYIVCFRDWLLNHPMTLALDDPKIGTIRSQNLVKEEIQHKSQVK